MIKEFENRFDKLEELITSKKKVLTFNETVQFTGLSKSYLYKLTSLCKIPHYKPQGKKLYFDREDLEKWMLQNKIDPKEIETKAATYVLINK